jgi:hypothetical protein
MLREHEEAAEGEGEGEVVGISKTMDQMIHIQVLLEV